jgi:hypothetical protein
VFVCIQASQNYKLIFVIFCSPLIIHRSVTVLEGGELVCVCTNSNIYPVYHSLKLETVSETFDLESELTWLTHTDKEITFTYMITFTYIFLKLSNRDICTRVLSLRPDGGGD